MFTFVAVLIARLLDPATVLLCGGAAVLIGDYRIASAIGAAICVGFQLALAAKFSWLNLGASAVAGALLACAALALWRLVPKRLKRSMPDG